MTLARLAILGSGGAGLSLALQSVRAGLTVHVIEPDPHALDRTRHFAQAIDPTAAANVCFSANANPLAEAELIFDATDPSEAIDWPETRTNAILATPDRQPPKAPVPPAKTLRMVPFQPMQLRSLTEITPFAQTSDATVAAAVAFTRQIGRAPVCLPQGARSPGLRLLDRLQATADQLLLDGAVLWELDEAMTEFGFDLGVYEAQDLTGLDVAYARRKAQKRPSLIADRAVEEGRIGKKIGWGWYRYPGGGGAVIDPLIEDLIREEARFAGVTQSGMGASDMMERLLGALRDEARQILDDRQVNTPADLDLILTTGLGYPRDEPPILA